MAKLCHWQKSNKSPCKAQKKIGKVCDKWIVIIFNSLFSTLFKTRKTDLNSWEIRGRDVWKFPPYLPTSYMNFYIKWAGVNSLKQKFNSLDKGTRKATSGRSSFRRKKMAYGVFFHLTWKCKKMANIRVPCEALWSYVQIKQSITFSSVL